MKHELRTLVTDLKAAARIGHGDSLAAALDGLRALPQVASNQPLEAAFISQGILPMGAALTHPRLATALLRPLFNDSKAALRSVAAVVVALKFFDQDQVSLEDLRRFGNDSRAEVRTSLAQALGLAANDHPQALLSLTEQWISGESPRLQQVALKLIPCIAQEDPQQAVALLANCANATDPDVRAVLVETLTALAQDGLSKDVIQLLAEWTQLPQPNTWTIARALSGSWAAGQAQAALQILEMLTTASGPDKQIGNTLQALERHGSEKAVQEALKAWEKAAEPNLQRAAEQFLGKQMHKSD